MESTNPEANRQGLSVADLTPKTLVGNEFIGALRPELMGPLSQFVDELKSKDVIPDDVSMDVLEDIVSKYFGAEGVLGRNPSWAEGVAQQLKSEDEAVRSE